MSSSNPSTPSSSHRSKQLLNRAYSSMSRATASSRSRDHHSSSTLSQIKSNLSTNTSNSVKQAVAKGDEIEFKKVFPYPASQSKNLTQDQSGTNLSSDQQNKYDQMLQYFKEVAKEGGKGFPKGLKAPLSTQFEPPTLFENLRLLCKESLLRYLRASKWDLEVAKKRLTDTIAWRREFGVDEITADQVEEEAKCGKESVLGYDNLGRPLHMMHPHRNNTKESPRQMQFAVWILERCIDLMPPGVEQLALLINFDSRSRNPTSIANAKLMLYILQNHYVERLGVALCINVPWVFKMFWNAIQSFIDPTTKSKCKFDEAVKGEVPPQQLTTDFGGLLSFPYNEDPEVHEKYWSQLVKLCDDRRKDMERRFKEECNGEVGASEWIILGGNEKRETTEDEKAQEEKKDEAQTDEKAQAGSEKEVNGFVALSQVNTSSTMATSAAFKTPSENISKNPLDRTFSTTSEANRSLNGDATAGISSQTGSTPAADAAEVSALETTTEKPAEEEAEIKKSFTAVPVQVNGNGHAHHEGGFSKFMHNTIKKTEESFHKLDDLVHHRNSGDHARVNARATTPPVKSSEINGIESKESNGEVVAAGALAGATTAGVVEVNGHGSHESKEALKEEKVESTPTSNDVKVLFFASSRDAAGTSQISVQIPSNDKSESDSSNLSLSKLPDLIVSQLRSSPDADSNADLDQLEKLLKEKESGIRWSVNEEMVDEDQLETLVLKGGEEVAVIPPVSGG